VRTVRAVSRDSRAVDAVRIDEAVARNPVEYPAAVLSTRCWRAADAGRRSAACPAHSTGLREATLARVSAAR